MCVCEMLPGPIRQILLKHNTNILWFEHTYTMTHYLTTRVMAQLNPGQKWLNRLVNGFQYWSYLEPIILGTQYSASSLRTSSSDQAWPQITKTTFRQHKIDATQQIKFDHCHRWCLLTDNGQIAVSKANMGRCQRWVSLEDLFGIYVKNRITQ